MFLLLSKTLAIHRQAAHVRFATLRLLSSKVPDNESKDNSHVQLKDKQHVIQAQQPFMIEPIRQELIKRIPVEFHGVKADMFNDQSEWYPIFRWPYVNTMRIVIKFKVYLTAFSLMSSLIYTSQIFLDNASNPWKAVILSSLTLGGLIYVGDYARRMIVQIYVSKDLEYVRFCRFTFFGKRRDMVLPKDCIIKLTEINETQRKPILNVKFMMPEKGVDVDHDHYEFYELGFRLPIAFGGVLDQEKFNQALGKILVKKPGNY